MNKILFISASYSQSIIASAKRRRFDGSFGQQWLIVEQLPGQIWQIAGEANCFIERSL
ncbi:hypothetical protein [Microcoleus sp. N3A4]|uniref:hypothetical protein n=1 Tax=Microcoleus sp. N3A4 TaxID=3055379 RepID=UPI002FCFCFBB